MVKGTTSTPSGVNNKKATKNSASAIVKGGNAPFPSSPSKHTNTALDTKTILNNNSKKKAATGGGAKPNSKAASAPSDPVTPPPLTPAAIQRDEEFLSRAIHLSREHMRNGAGGPFGAVIVKDGQVIAEGWNQVTSTHDPTAHGEIVAIRRACAKLKAFSLKGCVMYSSCEPCPMCLGSIYWARLDRIVFANSREQAKAIGFDDAHIYDEITMHIDERTVHHRHVPMDEAWQVFQEYHDGATKGTHTRY